MDSYTSYIPYLNLNNFNTLDQIFHIFRLHLEMYNRATEMHPSFKNFVNSLADFVPKSEEEIEKSFYTA